MLDDSGLEQNGRQAGAVENYQLVVIPNPVFGIGRQVLAPMPGGRDETRPPQGLPHRRCATQAGRQIGIVSRDEEAEAALVLRIAPLLAIPIPELQIFLAYRV